MSAERNYSFNFGASEITPETEPGSQDKGEFTKARLLHPGQRIVGHDSPIFKVDPSYAQGQKHLVTLEDGTEIPLDNDDGLQIAKQPSATTKSV